jgi:hypothetical protein
MEIRHELTYLWLSNMMDTIRLECERTHRRSEHV